MGEAFEAISPKAPEHFNDIATSIYERLAPEMIKHGLLTILSEQLFHSYCLELSRYLEFTQKKKIASTVRGREKSRKANPALREARNSLETAIRLAKELGLTPTAFKRMGLGKKEDKPDPMARLRRIKAS